MSRGDRQDRGYVLLVVLVAMVVITLLAAAVAGVTERAVAEAQAQVDAFEAEVETTSARETLLFLLSTQRQTAAGLTLDDRVVHEAGRAVWIGGDEDSMLPPPLPVGNEIAMDGTVYDTGTGIRFAIQDASGQYSPNWTAQPFLDQFLLSLGAEARDLARLHAIRLDYQDPDDTYRIGGAEREHYLEAGLPPPTNRTLATPLELRRMPLWRDLLAPLDDTQLLGLITSVRVVGVNVNTAPAGVLAGIPGLNEDMIERIVSIRRREPFLLTWEFTQAYPSTGLGEEDQITLSGFGAGSLKLWNNASGPVKFIQWALTPADEGGRPWRIDYEVTLPRDRNLLSTPARRPESSLFASSDSDRG